MKVKIKMLDRRAIMPGYGTEFSAGADLHAVLDNEYEVIKAHESKLVHTYLSIEIPTGYVGLIFARSGIALKRGIAPSNKVGVIDSDYRGEIMISLHNHSDNDAEIYNLERVAQIAIVPYVKADFEISEELEPTKRNNGGFGSTGSR